MKKIRIMIAEDFDLLREDWSELINRQPDMEVVGVASSGKEITALASETECDIILMDIEMETVKAGISAAEAIRHKKPKIDIIFLTAHETDNMVVTAMGTGAVDYVVKGCDDEELLKHIRAAYAGKPMLEATIQEKIMEEYVRLRRSEKSLLFFINNIAKLTPSEHDLVKLLLMDHKIREIAEIRCVEIVTVKTQIKSLLRKFGCNRTKQIVKMIRELKIEHLFLDD